MKKLEKEIKVLGIDKNAIEKRLNEIGAEKVEESLQQIYVYDLPSIYARFYDCLLQLRDCKKGYEYEVCRSKLQGVLIEADNLTTPEMKKEIEKRTTMKKLVDVLKMTENSKLLEVFSKSNVVDTIKQFGINPNKWVRLRNTNGRTTLTIKHILNSDSQEDNNSKIQKVMETEMVVPSIEEANSLLEQLGFSYRNYQEKNRATYNVEGVEIDIDSWPLIPTYIEIENDSENKIQRTLEKLGLQGYEIVSCNTEEVYKKYGIDLYQFRELKFKKNNKNKNVKTIDRED